MSLTATTANQQKTKLPAASELHSDLGKTDILVTKAKKHRPITLTTTNKLARFVYYSMFWTFSLRNPNFSIWTNTGKWKGLFIFRLTAITRNIKTKTKRFYKQSCYCMRYPISNGSRVTEYFMLKWAIKGDQASNRPLKAGPFKTLQNKS